MQCLGTCGVDLSVAVNISDFLGSDLTLLRIHDGLHRIFYIVPLMVIDVVIQIKIQLKLLLQMQFHKIVPFRLISAKSVRTFHNHQIDPIRLNVPNHPLIFQTMLRLRAGLRLYILIHDRKVIVLHQFPRVCHLHIQCLHLYLLLRRHPVVDCHPCLRRKF